ncbi:D-aminoacid aminotransferase-like PLP-dependent enzyme [Aspergillus ruber CBS 135680]|uniref:D-aminoacid aminotransferase-like PLP-dependent enzyme n=1 Tax=Aspergillus ruber (strain CBS 135680) TaxID=1388766 RepID=A0A017SLH5_ASPRC|nr:D-aminoacid aminotransferase-like PLP-dependent enzyme [Aspergillus ruber CBS 135680]EYE97484.1 D-aminoacid aminotransferase-like PLP-dependent enzyme [Aspergillus ruber CBS 135680]
MASDSTQSFQIISSLRYDPSLPAVVARHAAQSYPEPRPTPYYLLPYHLDRLISAARHFNWHHAVQFLEQGLESFTSALDSFIPDRTKSWRLRIVIEDKPGAGLTVDANPAGPIDPHQLLLSFATDAAQQSTPWRIYVDTQSTVPSAFTTHKTTAREYYTAARHRAGIISPQDQVEVLVVNPAGEIMEGSITTPYFRRRGSSVNQDNPDNRLEWITPPLSCGGNAGTTRRYALAQGFCTEQVVPASKLVDGEECWISNGVRGFMRGVVVLRQQA